mmetsp:Transcript_6601/g.17742  ORF Transcript_6601/g.17742 Transcript_6601/m.17742 type:complete len:258 (+) Transcript_6601:517-1290(+)
MLFLQLLRERHHFCVPASHHDHLEVGLRHCDVKRGHHHVYALLHVQAPEEAHERCRRIHRQIKLFLQRCFAQALVIQRVQIEACRESGLHLHGRAAWCDVIVEAVENSNNAATRLGDLFELHAFLLGGLNFQCVRLGHSCDAVGVQEASKHPIEAVDARMALAHLERHHHTHLVNIHMRKVQNDRVVLLVRRTSLIHHVVAHKHGLRVFPARGILLARNIQVDGNQRRMPVVAHDDAVFAVGRATESEPFHGSKRSL